MCAPFMAVGQLRPVKQTNIRLNCDLGFAIFLGTTNGPARYVAAHIIALGDYTSTLPSDLI